MKMWCGLQKADECLGSSNVYSYFCIWNLKSIVHMATVAELRINDICNNIYNEYGLESLTTEERLHFLVVFTKMLGTPHPGNITELPKLSQEELRADAMQAWKEYAEGKCRPAEELFAELEQEHPWAFK